MLETTQLCDIGPLGPSIRPDFIKDIHLERMLGSGATSTVYLGHEISDPSRKYAVKILTQYLVMHEDARKRWDREAKLILSLDHPNIVMGIRHGVQDGRPYLVMEYLQGETLADRLKRKGRLPEDEVFHVARSTLAGLCESAKKNILHRDIKPANIIWLSDDTIKLMDFGLAKLADDSSITVSGAIVGTPMYISPEQARCDEKITIRSDIYSLGVMLYHLVSGTPPFSELNTSLLLTRKITDDVPDVRLVEASISGTMAYFIHNLCQRFPASRPSTPEESLQLLEQLQSGTLTTTHFTPKATSSRAKLRPVDFNELATQTQNKIITTIATDGQLDTKPQFLSQGEVLFYEDDDSRDCYILLSGGVEILKSGRRIALIEEVGAFIGEMGPLRRKPRSATVVAIAESVLLVISEHAFDEFFRRHPDMSITLAQSLATRLERTTVQLNQAQARLAGFTKLVHEMDLILKGKTMGTQ